MPRILPKESNRRIGRAMHAYDMLADGDRVLVAVSGGIDSQVLVRVLHDWRRKAPINYDLLAVHIDMDPDPDGPGPAAVAVRRRLADVAVPLEVIPVQWRPGASTENDPSRTRKDVCYTCARRRRKQLFDYAAAADCNKLALGHHRDDIIETLLLNMVYGGNISTMVPRQDVFAGRLSLIRPLSFLEKGEIRSIADRFGIEPVRSVCPLSEQTGRLAIRRMLAYLYRKIPGAKNHIFAALSNVRADYLPRPVDRGRDGGKERDAD